ncbi:MAG: LD-carboxypeptidase [Bacteroidetes bacterium]|nr:LD-carboxypeptidase [Bacteroidota bacterium]
MILPPALRPGDAIAIVPTARAITVDELQPAMAMARAWGLRPVLGQGVGRKHFQQAGTAGERAADLMAALENDEVKAVWCARGGYGTVHLLELVDLSILRKHPKWIIGFSDATVLHSALHGLGVASLHAQMPFNIAAKGEGTTSSLRQALFGECPPLLRQGAHPLDRQGVAHGELVGGNLSLLYALRGTPYDLGTRGKVLFIEDLDELLYHMDRMVMNLKLGGLFANLAGLVVGGMSDMRDKDPADPFGLSAEAIVARAVAGGEFPVCYGMPAGHLADNRAMVLGKQVKLNVGPAGTALSFTEG